VKPGVMNDSLRPPPTSQSIRQASVVQGGEPHTASAVTYLGERSVDAKLAVSENISEVTPQLVAGPLRFVPKNLKDADSALLIRAQHFDGTADPHYCQVVLLRDGKRLDRLNPKSVAPIVSWHGSREPNAVIYWESITKAVMGTQGFPESLMGGLCGTPNWSKRNERDERVPVENLIPPINTAELTAYIFFDSNVATNHDVQRESKLLAAALAPHYAEVRIVHLPPPPPEVERPKGWGPDDYAAFCGSPRALRPILAAAQPAFPAIGNPLTLISRLGDIREKPAPVKWQLEDLILRRSGIFHAPGDEGKTTVLAYLIACMVMGRGLGRREGRAGEWLYITAEDDAADFHRRLYWMFPDISDAEVKAIHRSFLIIEANKLRGSLVVKDRSTGSWVEGPVFPAVRSMLDTLERPRGVVFDTLSALGVSESDGMNDAYATYHRHAMGLCDAYDITVIGSHHQSQEAARTRLVQAYASRSGTAVEDGARFVLQLQRDKASPDEIKNWPSPVGVPRSEFGRTYRLHAIKCKWSRLHANSPIWLTADGWVYNTHDEVDPEHAPTLRQQAAQSMKSASDAAEETALLAAMGQQELKTEQIVKELEVYVDGASVAQERKRAALRRLIVAGKVTEKKLPQKGSPKVCKARKY